MDIREAYRELGLNPNADDLQLKDAWRRLVSRWHPDRNRSPDAAVRIQRINKAYHHIRECRDDTDAPQEDVSRPNREAQPFAETQVIERLVAAACKGCRGSGAIKRAALFGWLWTDEACGACGGDGRQREQCQTCEGEGSRVVRYQRSVRFPAGVRAGTVLTVPSSHHDGFELLLEIRVQFEEHPFFVLEDGILRCEMPVDGYAWIANRWVDVPAPGGLQQMRLNRDALVYRLRGKGFPSEPRGPQGDYIVKVVPTFGSLDDPAQQKLLDRLILASEKAADASKDSALGQWRRSLKSWSKAEKKAPKD